MEMSNIQLYKYNNATTHMNKNYNQTKTLMKLHETNQNVLHGERHWCYLKPINLCAIFCYHNQLMVQIVCFLPICWPVESQGCHNIVKVFLIFISAVTIHHMLHHIINLFLRDGTQETSSTMVFCSRFLNMALSSGGKAEEIFTAIDGCMSSHEILWENCVAVGVDNTNVNVGKNNSIMMCGKAKNDSVYISGCQCHVVHNTSAAAAAALGNVTGFDIEDLMVDIYFWFNYSTKCKSVLAEYTEFCDQDYRKTPKHVSTRWLSLETTITRALKQ